MIELPPFPPNFVPASPEQRIQLIAWGEECARMGAEAERLSFYSAQVSGEPATVREAFTAKAKGVIAGDGQPCPNDHDPHCAWPDCLCRTRDDCFAAIDAARTDEGRGE
jgi:hypothetical protein